MTSGSVTLTLVGYHHTAGYKLHHAISHITALIITTIRGPRKGNGQGRVGAKRLEKVLVIASRNFVPADITVY